MTPKERMLAAMRNEEPDRVPACPDISNMVPARLTGKPFWDIYKHGNPPLWKAYLAAVRRLRMDGWLTYAHLGGARPSPDVRHRSEIISQSRERIVQRDYITTPDGELWQERIYFRDQPPWQSKRYVTDLVADFPKLQHLGSDMSNLNDRLLQETKRETKDLGAVGGCLSLPTLMVDTREGGIAKALRDYHHHRRLVMALVRRSHKETIEYTRRLLEAEPDFTFIGNSGMWLLQGERITREVSLPTLRAVTRMSARKDIPSFLHCCGTERGLVEICARESHLDCINPLERPPLGDCDLAEVKEAFGARLSLMGNLPTMTLMFRGSPKQVMIESRKAIEDAGLGGGFILSTGDQCPRDTPLANLRAMVKAARRYGRYT